MLLKLLDFLDSQQFIKMIYWAEELKQKSFNLISKQDQRIIDYICRRNLSGLKNFVTQIIYTEVENEIYKLFLAKIEENLFKITYQWEFEQKFASKEAFINVISDNYITVFQKSGTSEIEMPKLSLKEFKLLQKNPENLILGGSVYKNKGIRATDHLELWFKNREISNEFKKYNNYEDMVQFIENLELPLQKLFSIHQIGIIFYEKQIYLVKWIQYLNEEQILSENYQKSTKVEILENFGIIVGVHLKNDLELGNLVVFSTKKEKIENEDKIGNSSLDLKPLLSLDHTLFGKSGDTEPKIDRNLKKFENCQRFIDDILARIESGILLLVRNKSTWLQNQEELNKYIKISIEKVDCYTSVNQRLSLLRDLSLLNRNPSNTQIIVKKLEQNYLILLKDQIKLGNYQDLTNLFQKFVELNLYQQSESDLIYTVSYLFETQFIDYETIFKTVDFLKKNWNLSSIQVKLLEKPLIIALTQKVAELFQKRKIEEIPTFLSDFVLKYKELNSKSIVTLFLQIIGEIFYTSQKDTSNKFTKELFIKILLEFIKLIKYTEQTVNIDEKTYFGLELEEKFLTLSKNLDFIAFLDSSIITFLSTIKSLVPDYISNNKFYQTILNFSEFGPLVTFHHKLSNVSTQIFEYTSKIYNNSELVLVFSAKFIEYYAQNISSFQKNTQFFVETTQILQKIKIWIDYYSSSTDTSISQKLLIPLKKGIRVLLINWYLKGNLPEENFDLHKSIIANWAEFANLQKEIIDMYNFLSIKDFIWACKNFKLDIIQNKFIEITKMGFSEKREFLFNEILIILGQLPDSVEKFKVFLSVFHLLFSEFQKFQFSMNEIKQIQEIYNNSLQNSFIDLIQKGKKEIFIQALNLFENELFFAKSSLLENIYLCFREFGNYSIEEGQKIANKFEILKNLHQKINSMKNNYTTIIENQKKYYHFDPLLPLILLDEFTKKYEIYFRHIFDNSLEWISQLLIREPIASTELTNILKNQYLHILEHYSDRMDELIPSVQKICFDIFKNQIILNNNKKIFFKNLQLILVNIDYEAFQAQLNEYKEFSDNLADLETYYYSIRPNNMEKISSIIERAKNIISINPNLFSPWMILATCHEIIGEHEQAIEGYLTALKYGANNSNLSRLYHNLLVAYLSLNRNKEAANIVKNLDIGIKTSVDVIPLIRILEEKVGDRLIGENVL